MNATYNPNATGKNILGMIKGSDPILCNEYVIISAHLDHLGMIPFLIEGANDNNSSSAAMLGVAEALAKIKDKTETQHHLYECGRRGSRTHRKYLLHQPSPCAPKTKW